ncbi:MAG: MarR family transcriptional regulator [Methanobrevibacter sp.]|nr:MarR family transcriptional regulator [Methanobrevibacter sp.]
MVKNINEMNDEDLDNIDLGHLISDVNRFFSSFVDKKLSPYNITSSQAQFLGVLFEKDHISQEEICSILDMTEGTVARTIKRLEDKGFVKREVNPNDRRKKVVILTDSGRNTMAEIIKSSIEVKTRIEESIPKEDIRNFKVTILQMVNFLKE